MADVARKDSFIPTAQRTITFSSTFSSSSVSPSHPVIQAKIMDIPGLLVTDLFGVELSRSGGGELDIEVRRWLYQDSLPFALGLPP